jgi:hypothetical protein
LPSCYCFSKWYATAPFRRGVPQSLEKRRLNSDGGLCTLYKLLLSLPFRSLQTPEKRG